MRQSATWLVGWARTCKLPRMKKLGSYVHGGWVWGDVEVTLVNPATEEPVATLAGGGFDGARLVEETRKAGCHALAELGFAARGKLLVQWSKALFAHRDELLDLAIRNGGNTRSDGKFDVDGAIGTLSYYGSLGEKLGQGNLLRDGEQEQLTRSVRLVGTHVLVPRRGVALHINAFNFPAWNLAEKAAVALLAGVPVITKPATSTALLAHRIIEIAIEQAIFPTHALALVLGRVESLLENLSGQDAIAFTGSSQTGAILRRSACVTERSCRLNVEADSLNAAIAGTDVEEDSETFALLVADVYRDMIQKTGQKCTAIRRIFVPTERIDALTDALCDRLGRVVVGNPALEEVTMGPVTSAAQRREVVSGIARLASVAKALHGNPGQAISGQGSPEGTGYFVAPTLFVAESTASAVHEHEVFGPVATIVGYRDLPELVRLVAQGGGSLVSSVYSDDRKLQKELVLELLPYHGRLMLGSEKLVGHSVGPGTVLPQLMHGGPGRAGGGEELGGRRGLNLYMQRSAIEGDKPVIEALTA